MSFRNIIFDLGGVLLNIDFDRTFQAFDKVGIPDFARFFQQSFSNPLFAALEKGECTPYQFYDAFRNETGMALSNEQIAGAWNAMLLDFRNESMAYLASLQGQYRLFLLSNTNQIHLEAFRDIHFRQFGHHGFDNHFEKAWYSHELGLRKPNRECFEAVLERHSLLPEETLFVDDTSVNIEGAEKLGIGTLLLGKTECIEKVMPAVLL